MTTSADVLSLVARFKMEGSEELKKFFAQFKGGGDAVNKFHKEGAAGAQKHGFAMQDLRKSMITTSEHIKGILTPAMAGMGLAMISVGGAIAGLTSSMKSFGTLSVDMDRMRVITGLTTKEILALDESAEELGTTSQGMNAGLKAAAENLRQFAAGHGSMFDGMRGQRTEIREFYESLQGKNLHTAIPMVIKEVEDLRALAAKGNMGAGEDAENLMKSIGLDPAMSNETLAEYNETLRETIDLTPAQIEAGKKATHQWFAMKRAVNEVSLAIGADLQPVISEIATSVTEFARGPAKEWIDWGSDFLKQNPLVCDAVKMFGAAFAVAAIGVGAFAIGLAPILAAAIAISAAVTAAIALIQHWEDIKAGAQAGADAVKDQYNKFLPAPVESGSTPQGESQDIVNQWGGARHAAGGIFTKPSVGMIGEAGPEAVIPLGKIDFSTEATGKLAL